MPVLFCVFLKGSVGLDKANFSSVFILLAVFFLFFFWLAWEMISNEQGWAGQVGDCTVWQKL